MMLFALLALTGQAPAPIDTALARRYFTEAAALVSRDGGRLWGRTIDGALLFADPASRAVIAQVPDAEGRLVPLGDFYSGALPTTENVANHAMRWAGRAWVMLAWPPPADSVERAVILAHELWHGIQEPLGIPGASPPNPHLATRDGRLWLRLEARALRRGLDASGAARTAALRDAVAFRHARRARFPAAAAAERGLELNEGLAEYTGVVLAAGDDATRRALVRRRLLAMDSAEHFERGFAYQTGPAWGYFLDDRAPGWRTGLSAGEDLAYLLDRKLGKGAGARTAVARAAPYGYLAVRKAEDARAFRRRTHLAQLRRRFVAGAVLDLPMVEANLGFDPWRAEAFDSLGTVYASLRVSAQWGVLQCDASGGLMAADWTRVTIPAPADTEGRRLTGPGWVLELSPGWRLAAGRRRGDWTLRPLP